MLHHLSAAQPQLCWTCVAVVRLSDQSLVWALCGLYEIAALLNSVLHSLKPALGGCQMARREGLLPELCSRDERVDPVTKTPCCPYVKSNDTFDVPNICCPSFNSHIDIHLFPRWSIGVGCTYVCAHTYIHSVTVHMFEWALCANVHHIPMGCIMCSYVCTYVHASILYYCW